MPEEEQQPTVESQQEAEAEKTEQEQPEEQPNEQMEDKQAETEGKVWSFPLILAFIVPDKHN